MDVHRASIKAKLLTGKYPLQTTVCRYSDSPDAATCLLCHQEPETRTHFLTACQSSSEIFNKWLPKLLSSLDHLLDVGARSYYMSHREELSTLILDPSTLTTMTDPALVTAETITRNWCYALHVHRSSHLDLTHHSHSTRKKEATAPASKEAILTTAFH